MNKQPKRRRYKENPYYIRQSEKIYTIEFINSRLELVKINIEEEIFNAFNRFELDDIRQMNEYDNHLEHSILSEAALYKRTINNQYTIESEVIKKIEREELLSAIEKLVSPQKERIIMYYFYDMTYDEIATLSMCSKVAVKYSIERGKNNLKKILTKVKKIS